MRKRVLLLAAGLSLALLAIAHLPNRPETGPGAPPPPPGPAQPSPAPEEAARDLPEAVALERLHDPDVSMKEVPGLLRGLGRPTAGHDAIHELICWLEFDETLFDKATGELDTRPRAVWSTDSLLSGLMRDNPAVVALLEVGEAAAPQLVNEYLYFFENTSREAWHHRWAAWLAVDADLKTRPKQDPGLRLYLIWKILTHRPEVARRAVEHALARAKDAPEDEYLQRASRALIRDIVAHYPPPEQARLFPPEVLPKE
jgi:hypothetical protein